MKKRPANSALVRWHRRIGLVAAALVAVLALSGIALNHREALALSQHIFAAPWLLKLYGLETEWEMHGFNTGAHWLTIVEDVIFLDGSLVSQPLDGIAGAVEMDNIIAVAGDQELLLLDEKGELIEHITTLPSPIALIGITDDGQVAIAVDDKIFTADTTFLEWKETITGSVKWSTPSVIPAEMRKQALQFYGGTGVSLERIILEVHSGQILGRFGPWLMDGAAILLLLLAATGLIGWLRTRDGNGANDQP